MDPVQYYTTTLINAATKLGPILAFLIGGYFIFFKLPFLFLLRNMNITKKEFDNQPPSDLLPKDYSVKNYEDFQRRMKLLKTPEPKKEEPKKKEQPKQERPKQESTKQERPKQEQKRPEAPPKRPAPSKTPEEILNLKPGFTKAELKKNYYDLLRQNHPDKVASMGADFKKLADQNTKEINQAYEKLKNKAA
ncbi:J domain-containing protein [Peredibacter starrii]|uniref:J domain-containing protein n=1 Tax=Peredibacter starrii TaxID=28202 RepID=A0AAX4HUB7_9BACT|nr:J domain-containing protein [Peredibacter starrii]WPU66872.1 J domain-containing protein [Peredibacter starrii]